MTETMVKPMELVVHRIDSVDEADALMRNIVARRREVAKAKDDLKRLIEIAQDEEAEYTAQLREYFSRIPHDRTDKSERVSLRYGTLVLKQQDPEYKISDEKKALEWVKTNGLTQFVKTTEKLDWAGLKRQVSVEGDHVEDIFGSTVPGITVSAREPKFCIENMEV